MRDVLLRLLQHQKCQQILNTRILRKKVPTAAPCHELTFLFSISLINAFKLKLSYIKKSTLTKIILKLIEKDLGDWSPEKACCWRLMFPQSVQKPSSESSDSFSHLKIQKPWWVIWLVNRYKVAVGLRTPITQMIFFNKGMLLLGANHFLTYN